MAPALVKFFQTSLLVATIFVVAQSMAVVPVVPQPIPILSKADCPKILLQAWAKIRDYRRYEHFQTLEPLDPKDSDGLVASVTQYPLTVERLVEAYDNGAFVWNPSSMGAPNWYNPEDHAVIELEPLVQRRGQKFRHHRQAMGKIEKLGWTVTFNKAFSDVVQACAGHERDPEKYGHVWLTDEVAYAFQRLFESGKAYSVEVWNSEGELIGGAYGTLINGWAGAESMFHRESDAGRVAALSLMDHLYASGITHLDTMVLNENTVKNYGAYQLPRSEYLSLKWRNQQKYIEAGRPQQF